MIGSLPLKSASVPMYKSLSVKMMEGKKEKLVNGRGFFFVFFQQNHYRG